MRPDDTVWRDDGVVIGFQHAIDVTDGGIMACRGQPVESGSGDGSDRLRKALGGTNRSRH